MTAVCKGDRFLTIQSGIGMMPINIDVTLHSH